MRRKNTRRFDPRYFMDEKTEKPKVLKEMQLGPDKYISQDPAWSSSNPRELKPAEKLVDLQRQLKTAYHNPAAVPAILQQIDDLLDKHPELRRDKGEGPMAEGQTLAEISEKTPWQQVNQQIMSAKNALQKGDSKKALAILEDLLGLYPKFDIK